MDAIVFGFNDFGQLLNEKFTSIRRLLPEELKTQNIKCISFSWNRCYILLDDVLHTRGFVDGKISHEQTLPLVFNNPVIKISCAGEHKLCVTEDGLCWKFSNNTWENISKYLNVNYEHHFKDKLKIIDVCSSDTLHLALSDTGTLFNIPIQIETPPKIKITKVCCGLEHVLCLTDSGSIYTWGNGSRGQLGNDSLNLIETPQLLSCLDGIVVTNIAAGGWHSAAVTICGDCYTWGWNNLGQLGFPTNRSTYYYLYKPISILGSENRGSDTCSVLATPKCIDYPNHDDVDVREVSCGTQHTLILLKNGLVYGCGWNKYGQVNPNNECEYFDRMTPVPIPENVLTIERIYCESWNSAVFVTYKDHL